MEGKEGAEGSTNMPAENSGPLISIEERASGRVLAPEALQADPTAIGAEIGQQAVATTKNLREVAVKESIGQLGLSYDEWKNAIEEGWQEATKNDGLTEDEVRENWAAHTEAFPLLAKHFGMTEVSPSVTAADLSRSFVVAMTGRGTYVMFAPGVAYNVSSREKGSGLFAMTYINGRKGGKKLSDGVRPDEVRASSPANASRVLVYSNRVEMNPTTTKYEEILERAGKMPASHDTLWIEHDKMQPGHHIEIPQIMKVYFLQNPQNVEAMMAAFDSAAVAINEETVEDTEGVVGRRKLPNDPVIPQPAEEV